ncbi:DUF305 domain-containing protein [Streptosporangium sp. NPDC023615]|uniref:DUF305 domain-containing protein n=1 Tax=Streptosporangium sp. NPDC023615 TaxID=3154794 RepID=UPI0034479DEC
MRASVVGVPVLAVLTVLLISRCVAAGPTPHPAAGHHRHVPATAVTSPRTSPLSPAALPGASSGAPSGGAATPSAPFNATDLAWLQLMIPMTEQSVRLLELAPRKTSDPAVARFAAEAVSARRETLRGLRDLLRRAGVPQSREHEGHDMPGMTTPADFAALDRADGAAFDRLFTENAREYLTQSVLVAKGEGRSGADPATRAFAAATAEAHAGQLARLAP